MTTGQIVHVCLLVIVTCCAVVYLSDKLGRLRKWLAAHDERALLNRQRKAARDREMRKAESTADHRAQMHPSTSYCEYLGTKSDEVPRVRKGRVEYQKGSDGNFEKIIFHQKPGDK